MTAEEQREYDKGFNRSFWEDDTSLYHAHWVWDSYSKAYMQGYHAGRKELQKAFELADTHRCDYEY